MDNNDNQSDQTEYNVQELFDEILGRHLERLLGTRYGIDELDLSLSTISCLILLTDRENVIAEDPQSEEERFNKDSLLAELNELGLENNDSLLQTIADLTEKGYVDKDDNGSLLVQKPTLSMAQLLDKAFPNMPGLNFVAYLIQTIDELNSGRKDINAGVKQFDLTLKKHGVSLTQKRSEVQEKKGTEPSSLTLERNTPGSSSKTPRTISSYQAGMKLSDFYSPQEEPDKLNKTKHKSNGPDEINPAEESMPSETEDLETEDEHLEFENKPEKADKKDIEETDTAADDQILTSPIDPHELDSDNITDLDEPETFTDNASINKTGINDSKDDQEIQEETTPDILDDTEIAKRVAEFEEALSMKCPLCKDGDIHKKVTSKGKSYFLCNNGDCNFISWGQPYHIPCPRCENPFLIEAEEKGDSFILKCPRATCRYRKKVNSDLMNSLSSEKPETEPSKKTSRKVVRRPRRKIRRRRVVRRKA